MHQGSKIAGSIWANKRVQDKTDKFERSKGTVILSLQVNQISRIALILRLTVYFYIGLKLLFLAKFKA